MSKWVHHKISVRYWSTLTEESSLGHIYDVSGKLCPLFTFESLFYLRVTSLISLASKEKLRWVKWGWGIHKPLEVVQFLIFSSLNYSLWDITGWGHIGMPEMHKCKMASHSVEEWSIFPPFNAVIYIFFSLLYICMGLQTSAKLSCWGSRGFLSVFSGARCSRVNIIY